MAPWLIWLIAGIVMLAAEAVSLDFVLAYFGVGALGAAVAAALGAPAWFQIVEFVLVSVVLLVLTRPTAKRWVSNSPGYRSNVAAIEGRAGIVTIEIDNDANCGQVRLGTEHWTARALPDSSTIPVGTRVEVVEVAGVTALVRPRTAGEIPAQQS
jgi:membrane protein implicated in regulation of membrane protease activity